MSEHRRLRELATHHPGKYLAKEEYDARGEFFVYGSNSIMGKHSSYLYEGPLTVLARIGSNCGAVRFSDRHAWVNNNASAIKAQAGVDPRWLHAVLETLEMDLFTGGTGQPFIRVESLLDHQVPVRPIEEQRRIAEVLGALDDRIDVLRRLQSLLQDEGRALLALALADGAVEVKLEDIAEVVMGNSPPGSSYNTDEIGTPLFQGCAEFGFRYPSERLYTTQPSRMAAPDDTLVSVRAPVGKLNRASGVCCIGRGLAAVRSEAYPSLVHYALDASEDVWDPYNSEGTVFGSINGGSLRGLNLTWPADPDVLERQLRGIDEAIKRFAVEETELASARAVLLPALVSGELRVAAAEELVEEAT